MRCIHRFRSGVSSSSSSSSIVGTGTATKRRTTTKVVVQQRSFTLAPSVTVSPSYSTDKVSSLSASSSSAPRGYVIGIESTCDDTGVAVLSHSFLQPKTIPSSSSRVHLQDNLVRIESEAIASQQRMLEKYGGVVPLVAAQAHQTNLPSLLHYCVQKAGLSLANGTETSPSTTPVGTTPSSSSSSLQPTAIAVAAGPGLALCLRTGVEVASSLALRIDKPLIPVHHLEAHLLMPRMNNHSSNLTFPYLALVISGGHTALYIVCGIGRYIYLGETLDDAVGEAFDKMGRLLIDPNTPTAIDPPPSSSSSPTPVVHYGALLEKLANQSNHQLSYTLPKPLSSSSSTVVHQLKTYRNTVMKKPLQLPGPIGEECIRPWRIDLPITAFSVSGLKSAVVRLVTSETNKQGPVAAIPPSSLSSSSSGLTIEQRSNIAYRFQQTIVDHVIDQVSIAIEYFIQQGSLPSSVLYGYGIHHPIPFVISGGVASNTYLRNRLNHLTEKYKNYHVQVHIPPTRLCVDNGVMIAYAALEMLAIDHDNVYRTLHEQGKGKLIMRKTNTTKGKGNKKDLQTKETDNSHTTTKDDYTYIFDPRWKLGTSIDGWDQ